MKNNTVYYWKICNALICFIRFHTYLEEKKWRQHSWLKQIWGLSRRYFCSLYVKTFKAKFNDFTRSSDVCMHVLWVCIYMYGYLFMNMMYITLSFSLFHIKLLHLTIIIDIANKSRWLHNNSLWLAVDKSNAITSDKCVREMTDYNTHTTNQVTSRKRSSTAVGSVL